MLQSDVRAGTAAVSQCHGQLLEHDGGLHLHPFDTLLPVCQQGVEMVRAGRRGRRTASLRQSAPPLARVTEVAV